MSSKQNKLFYKVKYIFIIKIKNMMHFSYHSLVLTLCLILFITFFSSYFLSVSVNILNLQLRKQFNQTNIFIYICKY